MSKIPLAQVAIVSSYFIYTTNDDFQHHRYRKVKPSSKGQAIVELREESYQCCYHLTKEFRWLPLSSGRSRHSFTQMCTSPVVGSFLPVTEKRERK